jgi:hypothetical protein
MKMKPHPVPCHAEIAGVTFILIGAIGEHLLKAQDSAVIVLGSDRVGNRDDRDGAGNHDLEGEAGFIASLASTIGHRVRWSKHKSRRGGWWAGSRSGGDLELRLPSNSFKNRVACL